MARHRKNEAAAEPQGRDQSLPPLNWLRGFEATARIGSFTGAAQALGLTQAAVSYQVRSLEQHLGFPLFERLPHGVKMTDMGKAYLPSVQKAFDEIATSTMGLFGAGAEASLAVRVPISYGALWLAPRLKSFCAAYPGIAIRLYSAIFAGAVPAERVDIEIRVGEGHWPGFAAERIENSPVIAVGAPGPGTRRRRGLAELSGDTLIEIMEVDDAWARMFRAAGLPPPRRSQIVRVDSSLMAIELASAGIGHALVLSAFARPYLEAGRLVDLLGSARPPRFSHYMLRPLEPRRRKPEVGLFVEWLRLEARRSGILPEG
jgi:LysR family glycine cleavage system transcriptional activator